MESRHLAPVAGFFANPLNLCTAFADITLLGDLRAWHAAVRSYSAQAASLVWRVDLAPNDPVLRGGAKGGAAGGGWAKGG